MAAPHDLYLAHRDVIEAAIRAACRRHRLRAADAEDYSSTARLHLLKNDCQALRAFSGRSSFQTYIVTVLARCFLDWQNARWGKWRPSAAARRLGPVAVRLDTLISRDGLSPEEAVEMLSTGEGGLKERRALEALAARLPRRARRYFVPEEALENHPAPSGAPDSELLREEATAVAEHAARVLDAFIGGLPAQDRLILRMRFRDGFAVADIARLLSIDQKPLYRRIERLLGMARDALERAGITAEAAADVLERHAFDPVAEHAFVGPEIDGTVRPMYGTGTDAQRSRMP